MKLLGIDTSTDACTVGVDNDGVLELRHRVEARAHTQRLIGMIEACLVASGLATNELDAVVLGNGPGSFIGMRIGASVAQGIAFAVGKPLVPVDSLAVIAAEVFATTPSVSVLVAQDARMNEVYLGRYDRRGEGDPEAADLAAVGGIQLHPVTAPIEDEPPFAVAGAGWHRHPELAAALPADSPDLGEIAVPHARYLLDCGRRAAENGGCVEPAALEPAYIRQTVATPPAAD